MSNEEIQSHIRIIEESLTRFDRAQSRHGYLRRQRDRDAEQRIMDNEVQTLENYFLSNPELNAFFSEGKSHFEYEESFMNRYFSRDFHRFLPELRELLDE